MAAEHEARLLQYRVVADHRLHYGRLFFGVIAVNLALALAALAVLSAGPPGWAWASGVAGLVLLGTAGVAGRLLGQERRYAAAMADIEAAGAGFVRVEAASGWGARRLVVLALGLAGGLIVVGAVFARW